MKAFWFSSCRAVFDIIIMIRYAWKVIHLKSGNRQEEHLRIVFKAFAGVLNYLLCRRSALKILQHMSERSEFMLQNLCF